MIGHFPVILMIPGLLFVAGGFFYHSRAAGMDDAGELAKKMIKANRSTGNLSFILGAILLVIGVPLGIAVGSLFS